MQMKKFLVLAGSAFTLSFFAISNIRAADSPNYLAIIAQNTTNILEKVNNIPDYINNITAYITNWQKTDDSQSTADMQANFDVIGKAPAANFATQVNMQQQITADMLGLTLADLSTPKDKPAVLKTVPQVNNISYATLLGKAPVEKGEKSPYNYLKNVAGLSIKHDIPLDSWGSGGNDNEKLDKYKAYFNTVTSIESYDAFLLSGLLAEIQNGNQLTTAQNNLLTQASNSSWIAQIASEELGKVLRQILMFQSQSYVLLTQMLQTQKQQLAATAMTNSLLIVNAQLVELQLAGRAKGVIG